MKDTRSCLAFEEIDVRASRTHLYAPSRQANKSDGLSSFNSSEQLSAISALRPAPQAISVALVDDHPMFRCGVRHALGRAADMRIVAEGETAKDAILIAEKVMPDLMLLDIVMPGGGIEAAKVITRIRPNIKILFLTISERADDISAAMDCGALGYILKGISGPDLVETVRRASAGVPYIAPTLAISALVKHKHAEPAVRTRAKPRLLTAREDQILTHAAVGMTNGEIAVKLDIRVKTVKHYMTEIMHKLNVRNRVEAVLKHHGKI